MGLPWSTQSSPRMMITSPGSTVPSSAPYFVTALAMPEPAKVRKVASQ